MTDETTTAATGEPEQTSPPEQETQTVTPALFDEPDEKTETPQPTEQTQATQPTQEENPIEPLTTEDIKLPDGATYDEELSKSFLDILNDGKLTRKELGQKLFDLYNAQGVKMLESLKAAEIEKGKKFEADLATEKAEWLKQCQSDKEFGGQNWESSRAVIARGCKQLATPEAVRLMQSYNLNTHPEIVRMFYRAGKLAGEDKSQVTGNAGKPRDAAQIIFGESLREYHKRKEENK